MIDIIPAIDLIGGECVRLTQGDYDRKTTYFKDPLRVAKMYEEIGVKRLHLVDLDGAKASKPMNLAVLERIAGKTKLTIQYGGGIKSEEALNEVFLAGADRAICGSVAILNPELLAGWIKKYGTEHIILGADVKEGRVATHGWLESSDVSAADLIRKFVSYGLSQVICTDISKDGMLEGPSFGLYEELQKEFPGVEVTVSGGISSIDDIKRLDRMKLRSVIVGKAIYENKITLEQIQQCLQKESSPVSTSRTGRR